MDLIYVNLLGIKCQEASILSRGTYIPCGGEGAAAVWSAKDRRVYVMCLSCSDHNLRNRGMQLLATFNRELAERYGKL